MSYVRRLLLEGIRLLAAEDGVRIARHNASAGYLVRLLHDHDEAAAHPVCTGYFRLVQELVKSLPGVKRMDLRSDSITHDFAAMVRARVLVRTVGSFSQWVRERARATGGTRDDAKLTKISPLLVWLLLSCSLRL